MKNDEILQIIAKLEEEKTIAARCTKNIKHFDFGRFDADRDKIEDKRPKSTTNSSLDENSPVKISNLPGKVEKKRTPSGNFLLKRCDYHHKTKCRTQ